jgi:hypothetical protein
MESHELTGHVGYPDLVNDEDNLLVRIISLLEKFSCHSKISRKVLENKKLVGKPPPGSSSSAKTDSVSHISSELAELLMRG